MKKATKNKFLNQKVIITKIIDDKFDGNHPLGINEGFTISGILSEFRTGSNLYLCKENGSIEFYTSAIKEINEEAGIFETQNSTYKIEFDGEPQYYNDEECMKKEEYTDAANDDGPMEGEAEITTDEDLNVLMDELIEERDAGGEARQEIQEFQGHNGNAEVEGRA